MGDDRRGLGRGVVRRRDAPPLRVRLPRLTLRLGAVAAAETAAVLLVAAALPSVAVDDPQSALFVVVLVGVLNAVLYPLVVTATSLLQPGVFAASALALNAAIVLLAASVDAGVRAGPLGAIVLVLALGLLNAAVSGLLALDDDDSFHRGIVARRARRSRRRERRERARAVGAHGAPDTPRDEEPGLLMVELDGLSEPVLREAVADGRLPTIGRWMERGSHRLTGWECDASSQTAASQAGILHGDVSGVPAYRWYDRALGRVVVSTRPEDAAAIEAHASRTRPGLLAAGGASRSNLVSGGAPRATMTFAALRRPLDRVARAEDWRAFLGNPYALPRTILLFVYDVAAELRAARRQRRRDVRPRVRRGGLYPLVRAVTTSAIQEATLEMLIGDVLRGAPAAYATFVGYDEVAHHSGVRAPDALDVLARLDRHLGRLERAAGDAPRPYRIVVLSDHGQSEGATFRQRHGRTLEDVVADLVAAPVSGTGRHPARESEANALLALALSEAAELGGGRGRAAERVAAGRDRRREVRDARDRGDRGDRSGRRRRADRETPRGRAAGADGAADRPTEDGGGDVVVLASGSLGLLYLRDEPERPDLERIADRHPALVAGLAAHPGTAAVCGRLPGGAPIALGARGRHDLRDGTITGVDPLAGLGPRAAAHLVRNLAVPTAPDLLVLGRHDEATGETCAFEELVGHHGGLGGDQARAFLLHPVDLPVPADPLVGAEAVHEVLRSWLPAGGPPTTDGPPRVRERGVDAVADPAGGGSRP